MERREIMATRFGELLDMINCLSIYEGAAKPKERKTITDYDEAMKVR